jgi:CubicO group peptidase (beta-lactamase class C family)
MNLSVARILLLCILSSLIAPPVIAGGAVGPDFEAIDALIRDEMGRHRIPGLALAITHGEDVVHLAGFGTAGEGRPVTPRTPFHIGSISKSVTAVAVMQLVEEGRIDLDAPVQTYIPGFSVADEKTSETITVRHLLHQTSGLAEETYMADHPPDATLEEVVRDLQHAEPVDQPGSAFHYFNENYTTLGLLIERVSGQAYGDYVQEQILQPLGMDRSAATVAEIRALDVAQGHGVLFGFPVPREEPLSAHGMPKGGIVATAEDMAHYLIAHLNGGAGLGARILSQEAVATLHRPDTPGAPPGEGYAMGWIAEPKAGTHVLHHGGSLDNFRAFAWLLPEQHYGFVVLINQNGFVPTMLAYSQIPEGIAALLASSHPEAGAATGIAMRTLYWNITALAVVIAIADLRWWWMSLTAWQEKRSARPAARLLAGATGSLIRAGIFYAAPYLLLSALDRGFRWSLGWTMAPTIVLLAWWHIAMGMTQGLPLLWAGIKKAIPR